MKQIVIICMGVLITLRADAQFKDFRFIESSIQSKLIKEHHFYHQDGTSMTIHFFSTNQLDSLLQMNNLLQKVWTEIQPVVEQPKYANVLKRVDYLYLNDSSKFRVKDYTHYGDGYLYTDGNARANKLGKDTLRVFLQTRERMGNKGTFYYQTFYLTFTFNEFKDMLLLNDQVIKDAIHAAKQHAPSSKKIGIYPSFPDAYHWEDNRWNKYEPEVKRNKKSFFEPDMNVGFQYVRNAWVPSAAVGIQWVKGSYFRERNVFKLLWEPHFSFTRNADDNLRIRRNDFITFRFVEYSKGENDKVYMPTSFSIGYLAGRSGNLYEKSTFKFSLPGFAYQGLCIEPEFFFHNLFKQFSPSLKILYNFE
ncbi:MAG: hypothetical protein KF880_03450 [Ferruginibacter sp.]|nr:hypothetical protein [Ferruginibacter sp.]